MEGETDEPEKRGIVPNSFAHIFGHIAKCKGEVQYVSYINCIKSFVMIVMHECIADFLHIFIILAMAIVDFLCESPTLSFTMKK